MAISRGTIAAIRFGYGFHPDQTPPRGPEDMILGLDAAAEAAPLFPIAPRARRREQIASIAELRRDKANRETVRKMRRAMRRLAMIEGAEQLYQRALSPHGFHERLTSFWMDHFSTGAKNAVHSLMMPDFEHSAIRPHISGSFGDMLVAAIQHPAMLTYLDQVASFGPNSVAGQRTGKGLNENLAREVLELHTIGVDGAYTQADVRGLASLLTGYGVNRKQLAFGFFPRRAEPGRHRVLGRTYGGTADASHAEEFLRDVAVHKDTARHMAQKLAVHFVADRPDPALVQHVERAWQRSQGDLSAVYQAMLEHPAAWQDFGAKVKRPQDLVVSTLRAMGLTDAQTGKQRARDTLRLIAALRNLNQPLFRPPGPQGWPEEAEAWITPQGLAARLEFASGVGQLLAKRSAIDPRRFAKETLREALLPSTAFAVGAAPDRWEGLALTIASPEFNRR